jgi:hypothetical protein
MRRLVLPLIAALTLSAAVAEAAQQGDGSTPAPSSITHLVTHVPVSTLNKVGVGKVFGQNAFTVTKLTVPPLRGR